MSSRGRRFAGALIDSALLTLLYLSAMLSVSRFDNPSMGIPAWFPVVVVVCSVIYAAVAIYLTVTRSQSLGKLIVGMQIVVDNGDRAGFFRIFLLRNVLIQIIPCGGLIDPFFIFFKRRQCLHDLIASTYVIDYPRRDGQP